MKTRERDLDQIALIKRNTKFFFTPPLHWNKINEYENNNINKYNIKKKKKKNPHTYRHTKTELNYGVTSVYRPQRTCLNEILFSPSIFFCSVI